MFRRVKIGCCVFLHHHMFLKKMSTSRSMRRARTLAWATWPGRRACLVCPPRGRFVILAIVRHHHHICLPTLCEGPASVGILLKGINCNKQPLNSLSSFVDLPRIEPKTISCYTKLNNENVLFCASFEAHFFELSFPPLETLFSRRRFETLFSRMALPALAVLCLLLCISL